MGQIENTCRRCPKTEKKTNQKQGTLLLPPPERLLSPDQPTPEDPLLPEPSETDPESTWPVCRFSDLRRSTSACPTCLLSPTRTSPSRLSTLSTRDGLHALSLLPGVGRYHPALLRRTCSLRGKILDHVEAPNVRML